MSPGYFSDVRYVEALLRLGLEPGASADEVQQAYRSLAKADHPDSNGHHRLMVSLNEARNVALDRASPGTQLVSVDVVSELAKGQERAVTLVEERAERRDAVERSVRSLIRYQTSRLVRLKRTVQAVAYVGSGATVVTGLLRAVALVGLSNSESDAVAELIIVFAVLAALSWLGVWTLNIRVNQIQQLAEDATDVLSDRRAFLAILNEVEESSESQRPWLDNALRDAVEKWISAAHGDHGTVADLASRVGATEFTKLLVAKGAELDLMSDQVKSVDGRVRVEYDVKLVADRTRGSRRDV